MKTDISLRSCYLTLHCAIFSISCIRLPAEEFACRRALGDFWPAILDGCTAALLATGHNSNHLAERILAIRELCSPALWFNSGLQISNRRRG